MSARRGRSEWGRVRQLPSGRWQARYRTPDGHEHTAADTFATVTDARLYLTRTRADIARGSWADPKLGRTTVGAWADRWYAAHAPNLTPSSAAAVRGMLDRHVLPAFADVEVARLSQIAVREWVARLSTRGGRAGQPLSPSQVRQAYGALRQLMAAAVDNQLVLVSPCRRVSLPRLPDTEPRILTPGQVEALAAGLPDGLRVLPLLLAYGGLRIGEALALRRRAVDVLRGRLVIAESVSEVAGRLSYGSTKTHQQRTVPLPASVAADLADHLAARVPAHPAAFVFTGRTGQPKRPSSLDGAWRRAVTGAGLVDVSPHDLRATCASWVAADGGILEAARRLGHSRATVTTRHYARPVDGGDTLTAGRLEAARNAVRDREAPPVGARRGHGEIVSAVI